MRAVGVLGEFAHNPQNRNAVASFVRFLPWDSVRCTADEATVLRDQRIMAWKTPGGRDLPLALPPLSIEFWARD